MASKSRELILYCTGWYGQNLLYLNINQYRNTDVLCWFEYRPYWTRFSHTEIYTGFWLEWNKSFGFFCNFFLETRGLRSRGRRRICKTRFKVVIVTAEHQSLICCYFYFFFSVLLSPPNLPCLFSFFLLIFLFHLLVFTPREYMMKI